MAEVVTVEGRTDLAAGVDRRRVSWGAIFAGAVVAMGIWALLYALGLALGLSSVDAGASVRGPALFTGIWSVLAPLVALFVGGYAAARLGGLWDRTALVLHGSVVWAITTLVGAFALTMLIGALIGTAASAGGAALSGAGGAGSQLQQSLGVTANEALGPINERLRAQGKPEVTASQLTTALQSAVSSALTQGRLDAEIFERSLAQNTNLSREDVRELAGSAQAQLNQAGAQLEQTAASAADAMGRAFWGVFFALLLGLVSAVLGSVTGAAGLRKHERRTTAHAARRPAEVR